MNITYHMSKLCAVLASTRWVTSLLHTHMYLPSSVWISAPVPTSHNLAVLSIDPVATTLPD